MTLQHQAGIVLLKTVSIRQTDIGQRVVRVQLDGLLEVLFRGDQGLGGTR